MTKLMNKVLILLVSIFLPIISEAAPNKSDEVLEGRLEDAFYYNNFLDAHDISVNVEKGTAILKGTVPTAVEKELAQNIAMSIEGIVTVENKLEINDSAPGRNRVGFIQTIRDLTTSAAIKSKLLANKYTAQSDIKIETKNDFVTLSGNVATGTEKDVAEKIALNTPHVEDVINNLYITNPQNIADKVENAAEKVSQKVSDAWISTKVRSLITFGGDFPGNKIKVSTDKGVVTLSGTVRSNVQLEQLEQSVLDILGVKSVNNKVSVISAK